MQLLAWQAVDAADGASEDIEEAVTWIVARVRRGQLVARAGAVHEFLTGLYTAAALADAVAVDRVDDFGRQTFVEYALRGIDKPMGVAAWETHLVEVLPKDLEGSLPTIAQIEAELARSATDAGKDRKPEPRRQKDKRR